MSSISKVYQPIHPSIRNKLDPEYILFHDTVLQYVEPSEQEPWDPSARFKPSPVFSGAQRESPVKSAVDYDVADFQLRVFTPEGVEPVDGWPALVWYHGGGFVMGGLGSENGFLTHICHYVNCVVVTINYRHAPEFKHPTAFNDSYDGFSWVINNAASIHVNPSKIAIGGLSAGGCICAATTLRAVSNGINPVFQLLICPVLDNTATVETTWATSQHSPWLTPSRMTWYRNLYFSKPEEAQTWDASPIYAPEELLASCPTTFLAISECDLLAPEALHYSERSQAAGSSIQVKVYPGATHSILVLAGIHQVSQQLVHDASSALADAFGTQYNARTSPILAATSSSSRVSKPVD